MKKNLTFLMLIFSALVSFTACSNDDDEDGLGNKNAGSENTTDVAVTGAVQESGLQYLVLTGYVNEGVIPSSGHATKMGIQYGRTNDSYDPNSIEWGAKEYVTNLEGRKMTVKLSGLAVNHQWRFRTFVYVNGRYYFGETKTASTKDLTNVVTIEKISDITSSNAKAICTVDMGKATWKDEGFNDSMSAPRVGVVWSTDKDALSDKELNGYEYRDFGENFVRFLELKSNEFTCSIYSLQPNTTYYYCAYTYLGYIYRAGPVQSFTTPASSAK